MDLSNIKILPIVPEDIRGATEVYYKTWLTTYPNEKAGITRNDIEMFFKNLFTEEGLVRQAKQIVELPPNVSYSVAKDGGKVVGACRIVKNPDNNHLKTIYVLPEYQGKGIGKLLWEDAKSHCDPEKDIIVHVATYNTQAIEFYKKMGFIETGKEFFDERFKMVSGATIPETELVIPAPRA